MSSSTSFRFGDFVLQPGEARLARDGEVVHLEPRALSVLAVLVQRPGELVRKEELLDEVWEGAFVTESALSRAVGRARAALGDDPSDPSFIETVPTFGYRFIAAVETVGGEEAGAPSGADRPARRRALVYAPLVAGVIVAAAALVWFLRADAPLERELLAVVPFRNLTGEAELDRVGVLATEAAMRGIGGIRSVDVVPVPLEPRADPKGTPAVALSDAAAAARRAGAATLLAGHYSRGDSGIRFHADLVDVGRERILVGVGPVETVGEVDHDTLEAFRQRVMGLVASHFGLEMDSRMTRYIQSLVGRPEHWSEIPDYDAYVEFLRGVELFARDAERARFHLLRATELDPDFAPAWLWAESATRRGGGPIHDEIVRRLDRERDRLSPYERYRLEYAQARIAGDLVEARRWAEELLRVHPGADDVRWAVEDISLALNEPRRVAANLSAWRPDAWLEYGLPPGRWYFGTLTGALHLLGQHEAELGHARRAREIYPDSLAVRELEIRALAALGRPAEVDGAISESLSTRPDRADPTGVARVMLAAAEELAAHGHGAEGRRAAERAIDRLRRQRAERAGLGELALARCRAGRWEAARDSYRRLSAEAPDNPEWLGHLGAAAARLGDVAEARHIAEGLTEIRGEAPSVAYWRAAIAAIVGQEDVALVALREWIGAADGVDYVQLHRDPHFLSLVGHPEFREILAPDG